ncbi:MAG TPA: hypothetical protein VF613_02305 [Longimicrobium sp.]|jgi:hypothetical protein
MQDEIRVLFLASDPFREDARPRLDEEVRAVERALHRGGGGVRLVPCLAECTRDLQGALLRHAPQIVHFAGHDDDAGVIYLGDAQGRPGVAGKDSLAKMFGFLSEWIRVVVLTGSNTHPMADALGEVVDYAVGMDRPLSDPSAVVFAGAFYGALGAGESVPASFDLAVSRLDAAAPLPVLRM